MKAIVVGCALVIHKGKILIAQRLSNSLFEPNKWEFPGGKLKDSETIQDCIRRELTEELGIQVETLDFYDVYRHTYTSPKKRLVELHVYKTDFSGGPIQLLDAQDAKWVNSKQITNYSFVEGDIAIVEKILKDWNILIQKNKSSNSEDKTNTNRYEDD